MTTSSPPLTSPSTANDDDVSSPIAALMIAYKPDYAVGTSNSAPHPLPPYKDAEAALGKKVTGRRSESFKFPSPPQMGFETTSNVTTTSECRKKTYERVQSYPSLTSMHMEDKFTIMIKEKFSQAKKEVNLDLGIFAGDMVSLLEKNTEPHLEFKKSLEEILLIARQCAKMSTEEFWCKCKSIVQDLDDRRQKLQLGTLKQAHTRLLFILTRCTRLVQFHHEDACDKKDVGYVHNSK